MKSPLSCPVLSKHLVEFDKIAPIVFERHGLSTIVNNENLIETEFSLNIFSETAKALFENYSIPDDLFIQVESHLEMAAVTYIVTARRKTTHIAIERALLHLEKVEKSARHLEQLLKPNRDSWNLVFQGFGALDEVLPDVDKLLDASLDNLLELKMLKSKFKAFKSLEAFEYGKKAPLGNPGLKEWSQLMLYLWANILRRTITNPNDGINGRKYLFHFMCDCMELIHPELEYDTIDNALRKVIKKFRKPVNN